MSSDGDSTTCDRCGDEIRVVVQEFEVNEVKKSGYPDKPENYYTEYSAKQVFKCGCSLLSPYEDQEIPEGWPVTDNRQTEATQQ